MLVQYLSFVTTTLISRCAFACALWLLAAGCGDGEVTDPKLDALQGDEGKSWYLVDRASVEEDSVDRSPRACELDDRFVFLPNRAFKRVVGENLCSPDEIDDVGLWDLDFRLAQTFLDLSINNGKPVAWRVETLTDDSLRLASDSVRVTYTATPPDGN